MNLQLTDSQLKLFSSSKEQKAFKQGYKEAVKKFQKDMELFITEIDKTMVFSTMREGEIYDIQQIFRKYGYHYDETLQRWAKRED